MELLILYFALALGINIAMFIPAFIFKTDRFTDISYALSFVVLSGIAFTRSSQDLVHIVLLACIWLWAVRLGGFLLFRIWHIKRDKRFDGMREKFGKFLGFWLLQGVSVFVILISSLLVFSADTTKLSAISLVGLCVFATGLVLEAIADVQKYRFNANPKNKGKWIDIGVWSRSRHPNYLGEMLVWTGLYIFGLPLLSISAAALALISPAFIIILLLFVSGIPLLEKAADKKWGKDKEYQNYKKRTPTLLPKLF